MLRGVIPERYCPFINQVLQNPHFGNMTKTSFENCGADGDDG